MDFGFWIEDSKSKMFEKNEFIGEINLKFKIVLIFLGAITRKKANEEVCRDAAIAASLLL